MNISVNLFKFDSLSRLAFTRRLKKIEEFFATLPREPSYKYKYSLYEFTRLLSLLG